VLKPAARKTKKYQKQKVKSKKLSDVGKVKDGWGQNIGGKKNRGSRNEIF